MAGLTRKFKLTAPTNTVKIKHVSTGQRLGEYQNPAQIHFPQKWIGTKTLRPLICTISDNSMQPVFKPGQDIIIEQEMTAPVSDGDYLIQINGVFFIRRVALAFKGYMITAYGEPDTATLTEKQMKIIGNVAYVLEENELASYYEF